MSHAAPRALHQTFLPNGDAGRAFVWKYSHAIGGRRPRHFHIEPEINLVVRGSATFGIGERVVSVSQGELVTFPAGQDHELLAASDDLYLYAIGLDPTYSAEVLGREHGANLPRHVGIAQRELAAIVDRAAAIVDKSGADSLAAELWERTHGVRGAPRAPSTTHVLTRRVMQLLPNAPELSLESLARHVRAHPSEVSRHFHQDMGVPLSRYRTRLRLLRFIRLVDTADHDLMASASMAGFGSYSQAHRSFQSELRCAPRQFFREGLREKMQALYY